MPTGPIKLIPKVLAKVDNSVLTVRSTASEFGSVHLSDKFSPEYIKIQDGPEGVVIKTSTGVYISNTTNSIYGTTASETLTGTNGNDFIYGFGGNDTLVGGNGNDVLFSGGSGNVTFISGNGTDYMSGGAGHDVFVFDSSNSGFDTVENFVHGQDAIHLASGNISQLAISYYANGTYIEQAGQLTFFHNAHLLASDFI